MHWACLWHDGVWKHTKEFHHKTHEIVLQEEKTGTSSLLERSWPWNPRLRTPGGRRCCSAVMRSLWVSPMYCIVFRLNHLLSFVGPDSFASEVFAFTKMVGIMLKNGFICFIVVNTNDSYFFSWLSWIRVNFDRSRLFQCMQRHCEYQRFFLLLITKLNQGELWSLEASPVHEVDESHLPIACKKQR